jgi:hypothetical protein
LEYHLSNMGLFFNKKLLLVGIFIILYNQVKLIAQNGMYVSKGFAVSFFFDSSGKLANGITYTDFTEIQVFNDGTHTDGPEWEIVVYADAFLDNGMPLDVVEIMADPGTYGHSEGWIPLSLAKTPLITLGQTNLVAPFNIPINVSIRVGTNIGNRVTGYPVGYYHVNLHYEIHFGP